MTYAGDREEVVASSTWNPFSVHSTYNRFTNAVTSPLFPAVAAQHSGCTTVGQLYLISNMESSGQLLRRDNGKQGWRNDVLYVGGHTSQHLGYAE